MNDSDLIFSEEIEGTPADSVNNDAFPAFAPGKYINGRRDFVFTQKKTSDGTAYLSVKVTFDRSQFTNEAGETIKQYPPFETLTTLAPAGGGYSSVGRYLHAFGVEAKGLKGQALVDKIKETGETPVVVRTKLRDDWYNADTNPHGTRPDGFPKKDETYFKDPNRENRYRSEVKDPETGLLVKARAYVAGYQKYKG